MYSGILGRTRWHAVHDCAIMICAHKLISFVYKTINFVYNIITFVYKIMICIHTFMILCI